MGQFIVSSPFIIKVEAYIQEEHLYTPSDSTMTPEVEFMQVLIPPINQRVVLRSVILEEFIVSFDVITVEETWLDDLLKPLVNLSGYTFITKHKYGDTMIILLNLIQIKSFRPVHMTQSETLCIMPPST